jgi:hypothetical protein
MSILPQSMAWICLCLTVFTYHSQALHVIIRKSQLEIDITATAGTRDLGGLLLMRGSGMTAYRPVPTRSSGFFARPAPTVVTLAPVQLPQLYSCSHRTPVLSHSMIVLIHACNRPIVVTWCIKKPVINLPVRQMKRQCAVAQ